MVDFDFYVITDNNSERGRSHLDVAAAAMAAGASVVQLRDKGLGLDDLRVVAAQLRALTKAAGVALIINDHVELAAEVAADGVHLGQGDTSPVEARVALGQGKLIGVSTNNIKEAIKAQAGGADYLGVGPIFFTSTKANARSPIGVDGLAAIRKRVDLPIVAIGGINSGNAESVLAAGADGIAVVSAVAWAENMSVAAAELQAIISRAKRGRSIA